MNLKGFIKLNVTPRSIYSERYKKIGKEKDIFYVVLKSDLSKDMFDIACDAFKDRITYAKKVRWRNNRLFLDFEYAIMICDNFNEEIWKEVLRRMGL